MTNDNRPIKVCSKEGCSSKARQRGVPRRATEKTTVAAYDPKLHAILKQQAKEMREEEPLLGRDEAYLLVALSLGLQINRRTGELMNPSAIKRANANLKARPA